MNEIENKAFEQKSGDIDLFEAIRLLWRKRKFIVILTSVFTIIGIIYALLATPMYESILTLYPAAQENDTNAGLKQVAAQFGIVGISPSNNYNIPDVAKSRRIRKKIINKKWDTKKFPNSKVDIMDFWDIENDDLRVRQETAMKRLGELISVSTNDETGLISIKILTEDPKLSADIVNFIGDEVQNYIRKEQQNKAKKNRIFIEQRLAETKNELNLAEETLKSFREENRVITKSPEIHLEYDRLKRNIELKQEVYITLEKQKELAMIEEIKNVPVINVLDIGERAIKKSKPKRTIIVLASWLLGFLVSLISVFVMKTVNSYNN